MDAKEYLLENIGNSNLPEEMYIDEISEMMEKYGNLRYQEGLSEKSSDISPIIDSPLQLSHEQAKLIVSLLPKWTKEPVPKMGDPTMYGTATEEGDGMIVKEIREIFGEDYL